MKKFHQSITWQNRNKFAYTNRTSIDAFLLYYFTQFFQFKSYLEIGFCEGYTSGFILESSPDDAQLDCIDITFENSKIFDIIKTDKEVRQFEHSSLVHEYDRWYEFINIDGNHDYEYAIADIENALPRLHKNGVIMIDDIDLPGVSQALDEVFEDRRLIPFFKGIQSVYCVHPAFNVGIDKYLDDLLSRTTDFFDWNRDGYKGIYTDSVSCKEVWINHPDLFDQLVRTYDL
jgi:predicted O-methyltransferase YrrM